MCAETATGIIWIGPIYNRGGYGNVSRNYILGLRRIGVPVRVINNDEKHKGIAPEITRILKEMERTDVGNHPIGVINYTPDFYHRVKFHRVVKTVGCTLFETDRIPESWVSCLNNMDEVWVPSRFNYHTFSKAGVDSKKLRTIPYSVDTDFYKPMRETVGIPGKKGFTFLYVFAFGWRKGFDILLEAYCKEFSSLDDVTLILKVYGWGNEKEDIKKMILDSVRGRVDVDHLNLPHFIIMDTALNQCEMRKLYNSCDLYISTERAAGWGLPCMEAMAMGKPASAFDWGGHSEFMNDANSLLIRTESRMEPVDHRLSQALPQIYGGHRWPEVKVDEVRRVLRLAYDNRDHLQNIARRGMEDVREKYSLIRVAEQMKSALTIDSFRIKPWYSLELRRPNAHIKGAFRRWRREQTKRIEKYFKYNF